MPPTTEKKLSCKRCQFRKLKCSRTEPCSSCSSLRQRCEYGESDVKRRPVSRNYIVGLENRVAWLESLLVRVKNAKPSDVDTILAEADFDERPNPQAGGNTALRGQDVTSMIPRRPYLQIESEGSLLYHGPTSIFHLSIFPVSCDDRRFVPGFIGADMAHDSHISLVAQHFGIGMQEELVEMALLEFFKWQYPHFMFIYREAFLRDHFGGCENRKYWSPSLLFAICALGLLMRTAHDEREASERFFAAAETILLVFGLAHPCITTVQAFLCLAYYEIGRGNLSKSWGFSGIALRMAQDLGFQRDPDHWQLTDKSFATPEDMEVRRRIYWGCYISDKFISLILGRPVFLYDDDAEVEPMKRLPDLPEMERWLSVGLKSEESGIRNPRPLIPSFRAQIGLAKIIQRILTQLHSAKRNLEGFRREVCIDALSFELSRWESSLDESLKWSKWQPASTALLPNVAALHLRIIVDLETVNTAGSSPDGNSSRAACLSSAQNIIAILRKYRSQHGLQYAPLTFVYGAVQAAQVVASFGIPEELSYLFKVLDQCSPAWTLAGHAKAKILSLFQSANLAQ